MAERDVVKVALDPRVALAAERTLLAWIRTGLALMGFGFVVSRFGLFLHEIAKTGVDVTDDSAHWIGTALVAAGVLVNLWASLRHSRMVARLVATNEFDASPRGPVAIGLVTVAAGCVVLIVLALSWVD